MAVSPILSIVVPTRNRHFFLASLLRSLLGMRRHDFEVVVHDNSAENSAYLEQWGSLRDDRLRYFHSTTPMSITQNFERALSLAEGEFVCMIGDDDGVTESIFEVAHWMRSAGVGAATSPVATYLWPGVGSALDGQQQTGVLRLPRYNGRIEVSSMTMALDRVLGSGATRIGDLPSVYQGLVSRQALESLKAAAGTYFPGPSPDMANAVGLSGVTERIAKIGYPIVISGSSPGSGAAQGSERAHQGEVSDQSFLPPDTAANWPREVPFFFSGPTLWATTLIHALKATGRDRLLERLRFDRLYAACAVFHPKYRDRVANARAQNVGLVTTIEFTFGIAWVWRLRAEALAGNLVRRLAGAIGGRARVVGLTDISQVVEYMTQRSGIEAFDSRGR